MIRILLCGSEGKMGRAVKNTVEPLCDMQIAGLVDVSLETDLSKGEFKSFADVSGEYDCIIDFSNPAVLQSELEYAQKSGTPIVLCTTGFSQQQLESVEKASEKIAVFFSANMSLGVNLLVSLCQKAAEILGDNFDIEIIEKHHNQKLDAPSGTALMIANAINEACDQRYHYVYDRQSVRQKRDGKEIGISAVRGGNIVGEHEVLFAGHDECISIKHSATSKEVFAVGAVNAAKFLASKKSGMYSMKDML